MRKKFLFKSSNSCGVHVLGVSIRFKLIGTGVGVAILSPIYTNKYNIVSYRVRATR